MQDKLISATKLYEVESMLMTDSIRENAVASNLLHQVLFDIEKAPAVYSDNDFVIFIKTMSDQNKGEWEFSGDEESLGKHIAFSSVLGYLKRKGLIDETT